MIRIISILLLTFGMSASAFCRDEYSRAFDKKLTVQSGERILLEHKFGDIIVHTHPEKEVIIHADIRVSANDSSLAKEYADRVEILVEPTAGLSIRTKYPDAPKSFLGNRNISFSVHYELTIPETSPLELHNSFGAVSVTGLKASSEITTSHGELRFHDGRGAQRLEDAFAAIEVGNNVGDVTVETTNGAVTASDVTGTLTVRDRFANVSATRISLGVKVTNGNGAVDLNECGGDGEINNSFGPVTVHNVRGGLIVSNTNGKVDATNIGGPATLTTTFGDVAFFDIGRELSIHSNNGKVRGNKVGGSLVLVSSFGAVQVSDVQRDLRIESGHGDVSIDKAGGPVQVKTSFGTVQASNVAGMLTVNDTNGSVKASNVQGAQVSTSFGAVILENVAGPIHVQNQNGAIEVSSTLRESCQPIVMRTSFGAIRLHLQPDASYHVSARTSLSKIRSDFPLTVQGALASNEVNGTIGGGRCEMTLVDQNASIEILNQ